MMTLLDPDALRRGLAAASGAFVYGVFTLVTLFLTGSHVSRVDLFRALVNVGAAVLVGVMAGVTLAPVVVAAIPWASLRDVTAVCFVIGAVAWEVLPFALAGVRNRAKREADKQGDA